MNILAIVADGLTKTYPGVTALDRLDLSIEVGEAFGLLGENGAGKSTLVKLVLGFLKPTAGRLTVFGRPPVAARPRLGYLPELPHYDLAFSAHAYLRFLGALSGLSGQRLRRQVDGCLDLVGMRAHAHGRLGVFSKGMLQRVGIAQALLADPDLVILDEPTAGLDPRGQYEIRQVILDLRAAGKTLLLCSHILAEVEEVCHSVGILRRGRLVQQGAVADLLRRSDQVEQDVGDALPAAQAALAGQDGQVQVEAGRLLLPRALQPTVLQALLAAGIPIQSLTPAHDTLEQVYLRATGPTEDGRRRTEDGGRKTEEASSRPSSVLGHRS